MVDANVTVGDSACGGFRHDPQLFEANDGQRPEIKLARALEVQRIIKFRHGFLRRHAQLEIELANGGVDRLSLPFHVCLPCP